MSNPTCTISINTHTTIVKIIKELKLQLLHKLGRPKERIPILKMLGYYGNCGYSRSSTANFIPKFFDFFLALFGLAIITHLDFLVVLEMVCNTRKYIYIYIYIKKMGCLSKSFCGSVFRVNIIKGGF